MDHLRSGGEHQLYRSPEKWYWIGGGTEPRGPYIYSSWVQGYRVYKGLEYQLPFRKQQSAMTPLEVDFQRSEPVNSLINSWNDICSTQYLVKVYWNFKIWSKFGDFLIYLLWNFFNLSKFLIRKTWRQRGNRRDIVNVLQPDLCQWRQAAVSIAYWITIWQLWQW